MNNIQRKKARAMYEERDKMRKDLREGKITKAQAKKKIKKVA
jgi:hypothetical protein